MFGTLRTLMRASAAEAEEALIDVNSTTLLAQHLRDARTGVEDSRRACAGLMARKTAEERRIENLTREISERETQVQAAMAAGQDDLAADLADRIVTLEDQRTQAKAASEDLGFRITKLRANLSDADRRIADLAADLRMARSGAISRRAMHDTNVKNSPCALHEAENMAARVKALDASRDDMCSALDELRNDPGGLTERLKSAGLGDPGRNRRKAILDRLSRKTD